VAGEGAKPVQSTFGEYMQQNRGEKGLLAVLGQSSTVLCTGCLVPPKMTINLLTDKTTQGKYASFKSELAGLQPS
jgi:hypothetical protein